MSNVRLQEHSSMPRRIAIASLVLAGVVSLPLAAQELSSLIGVITEAADSPKVVGSQVTFTGLSGSESTMVWPDGYDRKLIKIYENPALLILQAVGTVGSTDTVYIEKKNKRFLVISVGAMATVVEGNSVSVSQYRGRVK